MIHYEFRQPRDADMVHARVPEEAHERAEGAEQPSLFEAIKRLGTDGTEFWTGRELATVLGYARYRAFELVVDRARHACENSGYEPADHFVVSEAQGKPDMHLSRYACYLIIQNSDPKKSVVALGQTYFAVQARRQELAERQLVLEDQRRLMLRQEVAAHNRKLAAAAKKAGVTDGEDFRTFQNEGYKGLYGGLSAGMIRRHRTLEETANILDYMGSTELAANLFRATQTEEKLRREEVHSKELAMRLHHRVGSRVRQAMSEISGIMPEQLPAVENINEVRKRLKRMQQADELRVM